ncbi:hypothetical protein CK203_029427 [Vitis vinifera]|uniref:Uncharacterized protein n=1 Tax=Vitis vinifera TaxID=29760 RepID=A0A438HX34_VITVI|nr:hypothetical protein CK203_029427 [Vitis vinifera]
MLESSAAAASQRSCSSLCSFAQVQRILLAPFSLLHEHAMPAWHLAHKYDTVAGLWGRQGDGGCCWGSILEDLSKIGNWRSDKARELWTSLLTSFRLVWVFLTSMRNLLLEWKVKGLGQMEIGYHLSFLVYLERVKLKDFPRGRVVKPKFEESLYLITIKVVWS